MFCPRWGGGARGTGRGAQNSLKRSVPLPVCILARCQSAEARMRTDVIVVVPPGLDDLARLGESQEHVLVQALVAQPTVEAFDEHVLHRLASRAARRDRSCGLTPDARN